MSAAKPIDHIKAFVADMCADSQFSQFADDIEKALQALDLEGDFNDHAAAKFAACEWIVTQPKPVREKLDVLDRLFALSGFVHIPSIRTFAGW
jgi:hypothetical protein